MLLQFTFLIGTYLHLTHCFKRTLKSELHKYIMFVINTDFVTYTLMWGLPCWLSGKKPACQCWRLGFDLWLRKISWKRKRKPTPFAWKKSTCLENPMDRRPWQATQSMGSKRIRHNLATKQQQLWCDINQSKLTLMTKCATHLNICSKDQSTLTKYSWKLNVKSKA